MTKQTNWEEEFNKLPICCDDCCFHENKENGKEGVETRVRAFIHQNRKELVEEILADIPEKIYSNCSERTTNLGSSKDIKQSLREKYLGATKIEYQRGSEEITINGVVYTPKPSSLNTKKDERVIRDRISRLLIENSMPTRQVFINEMLELIDEVIRLSASKAEE